MATMEPLPPTSVDLGERVRNLELRVDNMDTRLSKSETLLTDVRSDTAEILAVLTATKGVYGVAKKIVPRAGYIVVGLLTAGGYISAHTGHSIAALFGL